MGASEGKRKHHLVCLRIVCVHPKKLEVSDYAMQIMSTLLNFVSEVRWGLIQNRDEVWVKVLRSKYQCESATSARML